MVARERSWYWPRGIETPMVRRTRPQKAEFIATSPFPKVDDVADTLKSRGEDSESASTSWSAGHSYPESPIHRESSQSFRSQWPRVVDLHLARSSNLLRLCLESAPQNVHRWCRGSMSRSARWASQVHDDCDGDGDDDVVEVSVALADTWMHGLFLSIQRSPPIILTPA